MIGRGAACSTAVMLLFLSAPAAAHNERALHALTVLDEVEPDVSGLEVRVVHLGGPALAVTNRTDEVLIIEDPQGEPFLRIGPNNTEMNFSSPAAYRSITPDSDRVPPRTGLASRPSWVVVSSQPSWTWFDPRLRHSQSDAKWSVPMRLEGEAVSVMGGYESLHGHGHFVSSLTDPGVEGLELRLAQGPIPALFVRNETQQVLHVAGRAGEPMLRIGPNGVAANVRSPSYYTSAALTIAQVPEFADASARPRWRSVSSQPVWAWLEYRASVAPELQQRDSLGSARATVLAWNSPMSLGTDSLDVSGTVEWLPPSSPSVSAGGGMSLTPWWIATALFVGMGVVFSTRRRNAVVA
jgi:hypothetical protein